MKTAFVTAALAAFAMTSTASTTYTCTSKDGKKTIQNWPCNTAAPTPEQEAKKKEQQRSNYYRNIVGCGMANGFRQILTGNKSPACNHPPTPSR